MVSLTYGAIPAANYNEFEMARNTFSENELYFYDYSSPLTVVQSFYHYIKDFKLPMVLKKINFHRDDLNVVLEGMEIDKNEESSLLVFPSLFARSFTGKLVHHKYATKMLLSITNEKPNKEIKLGSTIYFGYPTERCAKVLAICTKNEII